MQYINTKSLTIKKNKRDEIIEKLKIAEEEIEKGYGTESDIVFKELRQKYGY